MEKVSVKYQVLSKHTNMIGVKKNKAKPTEVAKSIRIKCVSN
jgi:hypothetical protein